MFYQKGYLQLCEGTLLCLLEVLVGIPDGKQIDK